MLILAGIFGALVKWMFGAAIVFGILVAIAYRKNPAAIKEWFKNMGEK